MKILHTADWHVGRTIRGRSRADEHRAVLDELVAHATEHRVDAVLVAGDQFDVQAPSPEAEQIVWSALQRLADIAPVVVIAGNHDNPRRLDAVRGLLAANTIHAVGAPRRAAEGGVIRIEAADGTPLNVAALPFLHQRNAVRAADLLDPTKGDSEHGAAYAGLYARMAAGLCADMDASEVNVLMGHVTCFGGKRGGGEREAHTIERYCVDGRAFPATLDYVALGHLHAAQQVGSAPPVRYSGAPLMMDFGESDKPCSAALVSVEPGSPAKIESLALEGGRPLRTVKGTLEEVVGLAEDGVAFDDDPWIRVLLSGPVPAGVSDEVRERLGEGVVDVRLVQRDDMAADLVVDRRLGRPPQELFKAYLAERQIDDERIPALFSTLLEDELLRDGGAVPGMLDDMSEEVGAGAAAEA